MGIVELRTFGVRSKILTVYSLVLLNEARGTALAASLRAAFSLVTFSWPRMRPIRRERIGTALADPKGEVHGWTSQSDLHAGQPPLYMPLFAA